MWALLFSIISSAMIISHATFLAANRKEMSVRYEHATLADSFARGGLTDALAWYQKQPTQPVTSFTPQLDPAGDPPLLETLDPTVGLVREFEIRGSLWGRYEVRTSEAADISAERGQDTPGSVWDVGARSFLFLRNDPAQPFDQGNNKVVATDYLRTEMRGIPVVPPAGAAVTVSDPTLIVIGPNGFIEGGPAPAIAYPAGTIMLSLPLRVTGTPQVAAVVGYKSEPTDVFDMHLEQLKSVSDYTVDARAEIVETTGVGTGGDGSLGLGLPLLFGAATSAATVGWTWDTTRYACGIGQDPIEKQSALRNNSVFLDGNVVLDASRPLLGRGLIVVNGDLGIAADNVSRIKGILFVTGSCKIFGDFQLDGMLIVKGDLVLGTDVNPVVIRYDDGVIQSLKRSLERYRLSRSIRPGWTK